MMGPTSSIEGLAVAPLANDLKLPMLTTALSGEVLKAGPWVFKGTTAPQDFISVMAKYAYQTLKVRRCSMVFDRQNEATVAQKNLFRDIIKEQGGTIVSDNGVLGSDSDFAALSTKLVNEKPDCVFLSAQAPVDGNLVIQMRQNGLPDDVKIIGATSMATDQYLSVAGAAAEGTYMMADFVPGGRDAAGRAFVAAYQKRYGSGADNYAAIGYTMMQLVSQALQKAGPHADRIKFREALATLPPTPTILGDGTFIIDNDRLVHYGAALLTVHDGKFVAPPQ
jgi:branched-chain amino acid transport system substrate-binding protein